MMNLIVLQHRLTAVLLLLLTSVAVAQDRYKESFKVGNDVIGFSRCFVRRCGF